MKNVLVSLQKEGVTKLVTKTSLLHSQAGKDSSVIHVPSPVLHSPQRTFPFERQHGFMWMK